MRIYPTNTNNKNVPKDVYLLAETSAMSDEIITTYYADKDCNLWYVSDWKDNKPAPIAIFQICRLTGDCEQMVVSRIQSYFYWKDQPA